MSSNRSDTLQTLCRRYLVMLSGVAARHGLLPQLERIVSENENGSCAATEEEVELLSRAVDDERMSRASLPLLFGKSYRKTNEDGDFLKVKKLRRVGIYSKVSALLAAAEKQGENDGDF